LRTLRENAARQGAGDLVEICDRELESRKPAAKTPREQDNHSGNSYVSEYHFVCAKDRGVASDTAGRFWSGSWVVAETNVQRSIEYGAHLALHETKAEPSYRQGRIVEYRRAPRDMIDKENDGIEFLVEETAEQLKWSGAGAGEKGYKWEEPLRRGSSE